MLFRTSVFSLAMGLVCAVANAGFHFRLEPPTIQIDPSSLPQSVAFDVVIDYDGEGGAGSNGLSGFTADFDYADFGAAAEALDAANTNVPNPLAFQQINYNTAGNWLGTAGVAVNVPISGGTGTPDSKVVTTLEFDLPADLAAGDYSIGLGISGLTRADGFSTISILDTELAGVSGGGLTITPEPGTAMLVVLAALMGLAIRRRRG